MKVISQNLWNVNPPLATRLEAFVALCERYEPDVLLLQENSVAGSLKTDVASAVADRLGLRHRSLFHAGTWRGRHEGLAIVTKVPHEIQLHVPLSPGHDGMGRCVACVSVPFGSTLLHLATTHLAYELNDNASRVIQAREACVALRSALAKRSDGQLIIGGDLNCSPDEEPARLFRTEIVPLDDPLANSEPVTTWSFRSDNPYAAAELGPDRRIDYLFMSEGLSCVHAQILTPEAHSLPPWSDHAAVFIQVEFKAERVD